MTAQDLPLVRELESDTLSPWTMDDLQGELARSCGWHFVACYPNGGRVVGFICGLQAADEAEILRLTVAADFRRQGVAGRLLKHALQRLAADVVIGCYLEVRQSNPARSLYEKHGFVVKGVRKGYYSGPREDALIMRKIVSKRSPAPQLRTIRLSHIGVRFAGLVARICGAGKHLRDCLSERLLYPR